MTPIDIANALNVLQSVGNAASEPLVSFTRVLNEGVGTTSTDAFMDAASGVGHRIVHGHSLDNLPAIYHKFGGDGVLDYFAHGLKDVMSPHGMPIPFAKELANALGISPLTAVDWLCFNVGEVLAGGLSVAHSIHNIGLMRSAVAVGYMPPELAITLAIGSVIKVGFALSTTNPVSLAAGVVDLGTLGWALLPALSLGKSYFVAPHTITLSTLVIGAASGGATAAIVGGVLHSTSASNKHVWIERLKKISFSGAVGGLIGTGASALSINPVVISSAAVGGYVAGEWLYERLKSTSSSPINEDQPFLPEFLQDGFCLT